MHDSKLLVLLQINAGVNGVNSWGDKVLPDMHMSCWCWI